MGGGRIVGTGQRPGGWMNLGGVGRCCVVWSGGGVRG